MKRKDPRKWYEEFDSEADFQNWAVGRLRLLGYRVRVNSTDRRGYRQSRSLSDVLVRLPSWAPGLWHSLEFKRVGGGFSSADQEEAAVLGDTLVVDSWQGVCDVLCIPYDEELLL